MIPKQMWERKSRDLKKESWRSFGRTVHAACEWAGQGLVRVGHGMERVGNGWALIEMWERNKYGLNLFPESRGPFKD